jgi:hypothetical protein
LWNLADPAKSEETLPPTKMAKGRKFSRGQTVQQISLFFFTYKCNLLGSNISGLTWGRHGFSRFEWGVER